MNDEHGIMNVEGYSLLLHSEFDIQYSTCPPMPHADKGCIHRKLIIIIIKQHKPNGLWQAGILFPAFPFLNLLPS
jgi:hypothetical protein